MPKPIIKFNSGRGAILCNQCNVIIKEDLTPDEFRCRTDILYCEECKSIIENNCARGHTYTIDKDTLDVLATLPQPPCDD
jgi:hypothetical protein